MTDTLFGFPIVINENLPNDPMPVVGTWKQYWEKKLMEDRGPKLGEELVIADSPDEAFQKAVYHYGDSLDGEKICRVEAEQEPYNKQRWIIRYFGNKP